MLGRLKRTSRLELGLALCFTGLSFLVWAFVAGVARTLLWGLIREIRVMQEGVPTATKAVKVFFVDTGFVIDVVGLAWMVLGLILVFFASRQRIRISWAWLCAGLQGLVAALGAVLVGWAVYLPHIDSVRSTAERPGVFEQVSRLSLPVIVTTAVIVWIVFVIGMLIDRARYDRRGPTLSDGLRSNQ